MCHRRMAVMHLPTKFCANSSIQLGVIDIFRNPRWRPPPSWIFKSCKFGTFCHVNSVVLELYIKFGSNICDSHWDQHTYAPNIHLMTSCELTSGFDFWSTGHLRMAVMHLPINFGVDICRPMSGFAIDDWWSVVNSFDRGVICSTKRWRSFIVQTVTHQWFLFITTSVDEYAEENRREFHCTHW